MLSPTPATTLQRTKLAPPLGTLPRPYLASLYGQGETSLAVVSRSCGSALGSYRVSMLSAADICPITFEPFTESGPMQPRVLPVCGHTFSRVSLEQLLRLKENWLPVFQDGNRNIVGVSPLRCPLCAQPQKKVHIPEAFPYCCLLCSFTMRQRCDWFLVAEEKVLSAQLFGKFGEMCRAG